MPGFWRRRSQDETRRYDLPLRVYLRRLIWICMLPLVLLASYLAFDNVRQIRAADDRASAQLADRVGSAVDQALQARMDALSALSRSPLLDDMRRLAEFYRAAQSIRRTFGGEVILADLNGQMLLHTGRPFGDALPTLPRPSANAAVPRALATGAPAVGDSFMGPLAQARLVAIAVPVGPAGAPHHVLLTVLDVRQLQQVVDRVTVPPDWSVSLRDGAGERLAAHPPAALHAAEEAEGGVRLVVRSNVSPWTAVLVSSAKSRMAPVLDAAQTLAVAVFGTTLTGALAGMLASRRLASSVASLADGAAPPAREIAEIASVRQRLDDATRQRALAHAAMRISETEAQTMFEAMSDALIYVDAQRHVLRVNPAFVTIFGYPAHEVIGRTTEFLYADPADFVAQGRLRFQVAASATGTQTPYELRFRRKDGRDVWTESIGRSIVGPDGTVRGAFALHRDITERVLAEQARQKLEAQLLQAQKMEALGTLAGGIAHDFNNILTAIGGNVELALLDAPADSPLQRNLAETAKAAQRASDLVRQILTFSRHQPLERVVVDLEELLLDAVKLFRSTLPASVELATSVAPTSPKVMADRTQLHQVLMNLVVNAAQAIGLRRGRIEMALTAETLGRDAGVATLPPGPYARLSVTDDGPGMDAATRARIFDPFFTTKPVGEGTGLGLAVVDGIVKRFGGAITVCTEPGRGCAFHIYLPAADAGAVAAAAPVVSARHVGRQERILFLDDDDALVLIGQSMLQRLGYRAEVYTDSTQALAAFEADPMAFDALISDVNMPGASGLETAARMLQRRPGFPVALMSGLVTDELLRQAQVIGVHEVIYKPHSLDDLAAALCRMLAGG